MSFQARCASALRLALPMELKAHGAVMPAVDLVAALFDSGTYAGKVLASEFEALQEAVNRCGFSRPFEATPQNMTQHLKVIKALGHADDSHRGQDG